MEHPELFDSDIPLATDIKQYPHEKCQFTQQTDSMEKYPNHAAGTNLAESSWNHLLLVSDQPLLGLIIGSVTPSCAGRERGKLRGYQSTVEKVLSGKVCMRDSYRLRTLYKMQL